MRVKLDKILCAIDFSKFSTLVLKFGVETALRFNAHLLVFYALHVPHDPLYGTAVFERSGEQQNLAEQALVKIRKLMQNYSLSWEPLIAFGDPVNRIPQVVAAKKVDLVIAASHGLSGFKRMLIGTVVERLSRTLARPLLVLRSPRRLAVDRADAVSELKQIVLCCDFSPDTVLTLQYGLHLAHEFQATLHLVHAMEAPINEDLMESIQGPYGAVQQALQDQLHERLVNQVPPESRQILDLKTALLQGIPGEELPAYARQNSVDLVIVGVRKHGTIEILLIGSTTEAALRHAPCPVLAVPLWPYSKPNQGG